MHVVWRSWHHCTVAHLGDSRCYLNGSTYWMLPTATEEMHGVWKSWHHSTIVYLEGQWDMKVEGWMKDMHEAWRLWHHCSVAQLGVGSRSIYRISPRATAWWMEGMHGVGTTTASSVFSLPPSLLPSQSPRHLFIYSVTHPLTLTQHQSSPHLLSVFPSLIRSVLTLMCVHPQMGVTAECLYIWCQTWTTLPEPHPYSCIRGVFSKCSKTTTGESREVKSST